MVNDAIPFFEDGDEITCTATAAVNGKRFVMISGDKQADGTYSVAPATDNARVFGVAMWDAAIGKRVTVHTLGSGHIMPVVTTGTIAANTPVVSGAAGVARAGVAGERGCGVLLTSATGGADGEVMLDRHTVA